MAFETSCDETATAILDRDKNILANQIFSQIDLHQIYGGVVPEIAARSHLEHIHDLTQLALDEASLSLDEIDAIAVTNGPGLVGGLLVGANFAYSLAHILNVPCYPINHLEGHALSVRIHHDVSFPYLLLLASGGHCQIAVIENIGHYYLLGETLDDAAGETFDKAAKLLGLSYPGGPAIEQAALKGQSARFSLPRPLLKTQGCDFSFSGLKSALRRQILSENPLTHEKIADFAAELQTSVADIFIDRIRNAVTIFQENYPHQTEIPLALVGGVASNQHIRQVVQDFAKLNQPSPIKLYCPPINLCTDNALMIAWAAMEYIINGNNMAEEKFTVKPRFPFAQKYAEVAQ